MTRTYADVLREVEAIREESKHGSQNEGWKLIGIVFGTMAVVGALLAVCILTIRFVTAPSAATLRACDRVVGTLMESRDIVEIERAGILIRELGCRVPRHLPAE